VSSRSASRAEYFIIAGLSGAGRSTAADAFEDLDWFVIDNLPAPLIGKVAELAQQPTTETEHVALVIGSNETFIEEIPAAIEQLRSPGRSVRVLFLEASDDVLVRRFEGTRRPHPMSDESVLEAIALERQLLEPVRSMADVVIDTSDLNVHQLRDRLIEMFATEGNTLAMNTSVVSFGYKHGLPLDVDLVFDCRFLPNPYWEASLRDLTGLDSAVHDYVMNSKSAGEFVDRVADLLGMLLPAYRSEGKAYLTIAVGCTGGRHRSVVIAEELAKRVADMGFAPHVVHRDIDR
jgi:UPF0042 nucleotide-binding protein